MALYEYRAIEKNGKSRKGKIDASSIKQATSNLQAQGLYIVSISAAKSKISFHKNKDKKQRHQKSSIPSQIITSFTRQFSILVSTGIPYNKALEILIDEEENPGFQHVLSSLKAQIVEGSSLAGALANHPDLFTKMYVSMVRAGEAGGTLAKVLAQLAKFREDSEELRSKIQGAMIYPIIMTVMGIAIVIFMISFILPKIVPIFLQFDVELPLPTQIVMGASDLLLEQWPYVLVGGTAFFYGFYRFIHTRKGKKLLDQFLLKIPILGKVIRKVVIFRFTQTLGTMLDSGVELKQALDIVKFVMGNRVYEDQFDDIIHNITKKGMDLSHALRKTENFPTSVIQMIRVGEESSKLDEMLQRISLTMEKEVKQTIEKAVALLEPVMIIWMAVMVGFIILAVMMPMFQLNQMV